MILIFDRITLCDSVYFDAGGQELNIKTLLPRPNMVNSSRVGFGARL